MVRPPPWRHRPCGLPALLPVLWTALVGAASLIVLAACSGGPDSRAGAACASPRPAPAAETALLPPGLSFDGIGTVTGVRREGGQLTARAVSSKPLDELTVLIQDAVTAAGYRPAGMDSEADEAEVFFNAGSVAAGQARVERAECQGSWDIDLTLLDPAAVSSTPATR